jgi:hypothetical protein
MRKCAKEVQDLWTAGKASRRPDMYVNYALERHMSRLNHFMVTNRGA